MESRQLLGTAVPSAEIAPMPLLYPSFSVSGASNAATLATRSAGLGLQ